MNKLAFGQNMTQGSIARILVRFAFPLLLANLLQQLYNSVDMMIVGKVLGSVGTVSVSNGGEIISLITFAGMAFGGASQIYTAQLVGKGLRRDIPLVSGTILSFTTGVGVIAGLLCLCCSRQLIALLNCPPEAYEQACGYMWIASMGLPFVFGYNAVCGIMRGMGESRRPLVFVAIASVVNVLLDLMLVKVFSLRAQGSAIATVTAQFISFLSAVIYMYRHRAENDFCSQKDHFKIRSQFLRPLLHIGIPLTMQSLFIHFSQLICVTWVNGFGIVAASTTSIGNKIGRLIHVMTSSITNAAGAVAAQNIGAKLHDRVKTTVSVALVICAGICVLEYLVAIFIPKTLFSMFTNDPRVIEMGVTYLRVSLITFALSAMQGPFTSVVTGSGNAKLSFAYGLIDGIVLRLGISYTLMFVYNLGVIGFWYGDALAHLGPVVIAAVYYFSGKWKTYQFIRLKDAQSEA